MLAHKPRLNSVNTASFCVRSARKKLDLYFLARFLVIMDIVTCNDIFGKVMCSEECSSERLLYPQIVAGGRVNSNRRPPSPNITTEGNFFGIPLY